MTSQNSESTTGALDGAGWSSGTFSPDNAGTRSWSTLSENAGGLDSARTRGSSYPDPSHSPVQEISGPAAGAISSQQADDRISVMNGSLLSQLISPDNSSTHRRAFLASDISTASPENEQVDSGPTTDYPYIPPTSVSFSSSLIMDNATKYVDEDSEETIPKDLFSFYNDSSHESHSEASITNEQTSAFENLGVFNISSSTGVSSGSFTNVTSIFDTLNITADGELFSPPISNQTSPSGDFLLSFPPPTPSSSQTTLLSKLTDGHVWYNEYVTSVVNTFDDALTTSQDGDSGESWETIIKVFVLVVISLVGTFGNLLVIYSIVKERHLHRPPFYVLLSLGVTDLSRAIFCVPVVISTVLGGSHWSHGDSACKLFAFATSFFVYSSVLSLLAISIDRHVSMVYAKTYRRRSHGIANLVIVVVVWTLAFCVSFPPVLGLGDYVFIPGEGHCAYSHKHYSHNDPAVASVFIFLVILFLAYFLYFRVFKFLRSHRKMRPLQHQPARSATWAFVGQGANGQAFINWLNGFGGQVPVRQAGQRQVQRLNFGRVVNLSSAKNEHLTRLFLTLTLVFGAMWTPYVVLSLWRIFGNVEKIPEAYITVSAWLGYGQTAVCPLVYLLVKRRSRAMDKTVYSSAEKKEFLLENKIRK